ncbi:MAG: mechanosensitive ion channel family protein [Burkholderiales bacterium]
MQQFFAELPAWVVSVIVLALMVLVGLVAHYVVYAAATRIARRTPRPLDDLLVRHSRKPARLLFPLVFIIYAWNVIPPAPEIAFLGDRVLGVLFVASVAWLLVKMLTALSELLELRYPLNVADNLAARRIWTQANIFRQIGTGIVCVVAGALILMKIPGVENLGTSLLASAGIVGIIVGAAARPALSNLIAGLQIALTQPIRLEDVVIVEGEWGQIEEISNTYIVVRIWDLRRLIVPLSYFIEKPFQNWTRQTTDLLGTVFVNVDYTVPFDEVRAALHRILQSSKLWDGKVWNLQVVEATEHTVQLRALMSAPDASTAWDLRCEVRERLIAFVQERFPDSLPRARAEIRGALDTAGREQLHGKAPGPDLLPSPRGEESGATHEPEPTRV